MTITEKATAFTTALKQYELALEDQHRFLATRKPAPLEPAAQKLQEALRNLLADAE